MQKLDNMEELFKRFIDINKEDALDENISLKVIGLDYEDLFNYFKGGKYPFNEKELIVDFIQYLSDNNYKIYDCKEIQKVYINLIDIDDSRFSSIVEKCIKGDTDIQEKNKKKKHMNIIIGILSVIFFILLFTVLF